jgi:acyl dehydratase
MPNLDRSTELYWEDLSVGDVMRSGTWTIDAAQIVAFASEFDPQPFHTDLDAAPETFFRGLVASGWHVAAITMRLIVDSTPLADGVIGVGADVAWPSATRPGDKLHVVSEVIALTPSRSKPDRGIATVRSETRTEAGEVRQRSTAKLVVFRRPG